MNFKRCTAVLLCVALLTSGGVFNTVVSAVGDSNSTVNQSMNNVIVDETGSVIRFIGDKDYFTDGVLNSKGYLKSYTNKMLTNIRFKTVFNSKYGK